MKTITLQINGLTIEAGYEVLNEDVAEIEIISPFKGLKYQYATESNDHNLLYRYEAERFVKGKLHKLMNQIQVVKDNRQIYQEFNDKYRKITEEKWDEIQRLEFSSDEEQFRYHLELMDKVLNDFYNELKSVVPAFPAIKEDEFLIHPALLSQILSSI